MAQAPRMRDVEFKQAFWILLHHLFMRKNLLGPVFLDQEAPVALLAVHAQNLIGLVGQFYRL